MYLSTVPSFSMIILSFLLSSWTFPPEDVAWLNFTNVGIFDPTHFLTAVSQLNSYTHCLPYVVLSFSWLTDHRIDKLALLQYCGINIVMMDGTSIMKIKWFLLLTTFDFKIVLSTDFFMLTYNWLLLLQCVTMYVQCKTFPTAYKFQFHWLFYLQCTDEGWSKHVINKILDSYHLQISTSFGESYRDNCISLTHFPCTNCTRF